MTSIKEELTNTLQVLLKTVPSSVVNGSWNISVSYKDWVVKTNKVVNGDRANEATLRSLINQYHHF